MQTTTGTPDAAEHGLVVDGLLEFTRQEVLTIEERLGETLHNPRRRFDEDGREVEAVVEARRAVRMASARAGYYAMFTPAEVGGGGLGATVYFLCYEALHHRFGAGHPLVDNVLAHWASGPSRIWEGASPRLRDDVLPDLLSGRKLGCFGMSEPDAGSDAWRMRTTAERDGDDWVLNGQKQWTSFSPIADCALVFAVTDRELQARRRGGVTAFYVPFGTPGFALDSIIRVWGDIGGNEGILSFSDCRVPDGYRVGAVHEGFRLAMMGANFGRLYNTARSVGLSRWALECATGYAKTRETFGKPIAEHQSIQNMLADSVVELYAARTMALDCARRADAGADVRAEMAMIKLYATNMANRVFDRVIQVHGGMGVTNELHFTEGYHTVRTIRIADGTDEILRRTIAKELLAGRIAL
jgi:acyl-CoA dehydrogenase